MKGILIVLSGFSGAGKGTLMKGLLEKYPDDYALSISATSRGPRPGEQDGREYFFKSREEFEEMIQNGDLLEYAEYVGNYYGTPKPYVISKLEQGKSVFLEIEMQGAMKIKKSFPETKFIFVCAPSAQELKERLEGRQTETKDVIMKRLSRAVEESDGIEDYQYLIVNDDLESTIERLHKLIENEKRGNSDLNAKHSVASQIDFIKNTKEELKSLLKGVNL